MIAFALKPDRSGFWYRVDAPPGSRFWIRYIALGIQGHQTSGEITGTIDGDAEWSFWPTHFEVVHAAMYACDVDGHGAFASPRGSNVPSSSDPDGQVGAMTFAAADHEPTFSSPYDPYPGS